MLFSVLSTANVALREDIFQQLTKLVAFVKQHIRRFLPDLIQLIHTHWSSSTRLCLQLLSELSTSLRCHSHASASHTHTSPSHASAALL